MTALGKAIARGYKATRDGDYQAYRKVTGKFGMTSNELIASGDDVGRAADVIAKPDYDNIIDTFKFLGDPAKNLLGPGRINNNTEWNSLINEVVNAGGEVIFRQGSIAYSPGLRKGAPGQLIIDPDASISALRHEHRHFIDDKLAGFKGYEGIRDVNFRITSEFSANKLEIQDMIHKRRRDLADQLKQNIRDEVNFIKDNYDIHTTQEVETLIQQLLNL